MAVTPPKFANGSPHESVEKVTSVIRVAATPAYNSITLAAQVILLIIGGSGQVRLVFNVDGVGSIQANDR